MITRSHIALRIAATKPPRCQADNQEVAAAAAAEIAETVAVAEVVEIVEEVEAVSEVDNRTGVEEAVREAIALGEGVLLELVKACK